GLNSKGYAAWWVDDGPLWLLHGFVGAIGTCERFGFSPEVEPHSQDIAHGIFERYMRFEFWIGIDVCVDFKIYLVFVQERTEVVGGVNRFLDFEQHAFFDAHIMSFAVLMDKHKSAFVLSEKNDDRCKFDSAALHL